MSTPTGWQCPNCGACYSPFQSRCVNCVGAIPTVTTHTTAPQTCANCGQQMAPNHRCVVSRVIL